MAVPSAFGSLARVGKPIVSARAGIGGISDGMPRVNSNAGAPPSDAAMARQRAFDFAQNARNNNLGGQFHDRQTNATYVIPGAGGSGGSGSRGPSGPGDDGGRYEDTFDVDIARAKAHLPPPLAPAPPPPPPGDPSASNSASFSRAKDRLGKLGRGAMDSLSRAMASRNLAGSTIEGDAISNIVGGTQGELGDVVRDQAIEGYRREGDVADRNLNYGLQTRGQDITARGQDFSHLQGLMGLLRASRRRVAY